MSLDALEALEERIDKAVGTITQLKKDEGSTGRARTAQT